MPNSLLSKLWNQLPGLYWVVDRDFNWIALSKAYRDWLGEDENDTELIGKNIFAHLADKSYAHLLGGVDSLKKHLEQVCQSRQEVKHMSQTRSEGFNEHGYALALTYIPVLDELGQVEYILHQAREISQKEKEDHQLWEAKKLAKKTFNAIRYPMLILNAELRLMSANKAFYRTFQMQKEEAEGRLIFELKNHAWEIPQLRKLLEAVVSHDQIIHDYELAHDFEFLGRRILLLNASRIDQLQLILLAIEDITERKEADDELRRRKAEFKAHFHQKLVGNARSDAETGKFLLVNQKLCEITGYHESELLERSFWDLTDPEDKEENKHLLAELLRSKRPSIEFEKRIIKKSGQKLWVSVYVNIDQYDLQGNPISTCAVVLDISERKQAEEAQQQMLMELERKAKEFNTVLSTIDDGIFIVNRHKRFVYCNPKNLKFLGKKTLEEVRGKTLTDLKVSPEVIKLVHHSYEMVFRTKRSSAHTVTFSNSAGKTFYLEYILVPIFAADGEVESIVGSTRDITERRITEEVVSQNEKELAAIFSKAAVGLTKISLDGKFLKLNDEICRILGRSREELMNMGLPDVTHPEDISNTFSAFEHLLKTGEAISIDKRYVKPDGTLVWANSIVTLLKDEQGNPRSVLAVTVDLTERTKTEQALRKSEEQLAYEVRSLNELHRMTMEVLETHSLQEALDKMLETTINLLQADFGNIQLYNPQKRRLEIAANHGFSEDYLKMFGFLDIKENTLCNQAFRSGRRCVIEDVEKDENFQEYTLLALTTGYRSVQSTPLISRNGEVIGILSTYYHKSGKLSDRSKKILDLLTRQIADLIDNREVEEALRHAKVKAEIAARAKEDFLAHMSHEIRTPLNAVLGLTNLISNHNRQPELNENLQTLKFSAENLKTLVNDILDFSKIQAGKVAVDETHVNFKRLMESLYKAHQPHALENGNELKFELDERIPEVICADQLKLSQVIHNLLSNAIKFTEKGTIKVDVKLKKQTKKRFWIDFSVSDTGIGMSSDKLSTIFDAFTQADNSTVKRYGGTGLGLSITKLLLEMMGGKIKVESNEGEGSCFYFTLVVKKGDVAKVQDNEEEPFQETEGEPHEPQFEILLTEDEAINRMVVIQFLHDWWQLHPDEAVDGEEAIKMAASKHYDIILMDIRMPQMDGYQATQQIRSLNDDFYQHVPIIALTADTSQEVQKHPLAHLFTDIITKPFDPHELRKKLLEYIPENKKITKSQEPNIKLDVHHVHEIFQGDSQMVKQFYTKAIKGFYDFQEQYISAMSHRDRSTLSSSSHKLALTLKILALNELKTFIDDCKMLLEEDVPQEELEKAKTKGKEMISQTICSLKQQKVKEEKN